MPVAVTWRRLRAAALTTAIMRRCLPNDMQADPSDEIAGLGIALSSQDTELAKVLREVLRLAWGPSRDDLLVSHT